MKITNRQLRRIIREEIQKQNDGRTVVGTHKGKEWAVRIPDDLAAFIIDIHQSYMDGDDDNASYDLVDAAYRIHNYIQGEVEKQVGVSIPYQNYDSYDETGLADDLSDAMVDAASEE